MSSTHYRFLQFCLGSLRAYARLVLAGSLIAALSGCSDDTSEGDGSSYGRGNRSVNVVAVPATLEKLIESVQAVGTTRALKSVALYPETAGIVTAVSFEPDSSVKAGDVLLQLDDRDERLAVRLAQVQLADAERLVQRYTSVNRDETNIPQSQIDTAKAAVDTAQIVLEQAQLDLSRRQMTAPFDGRVGITDIDVGDRIDTATLVTTLDDRKTLLVNFMIPEIFIGQVTSGTAVSVQLWNSGRPAFSGEVIAVDSRIDTASRAFTARAAIDNQQDRFRPGMAFEIAISTSRGEFIAVPDVAVQWGADGPYIWIARDGKAARADVRLVKRLPNRLLIETDIAVGTPVIAEGVQSVRAGVALNLQDTTSRELSRTPPAHGEKDMSNDGA